MHVERRYSVTPDVLLGVLTDADFLAARNARYGGAGEPVIARDESHVVITVPRQLPLEHVPSAFHRFIGDGRFIEIDTWTSVAGDHAAGYWTVNTHRAPISLDGTHTLTATGDGCIHVVTGEVRVSLPLVGGKLAREVDAHLSELVQHEMAFTAGWLDDDQAS
jgi:hypothetical protein